MKSFWLIILFVFVSFSISAGCISGDCDNGFGTYSWKDGGLYSGFWKNGKKHYFGMQFWKDGDFWYGLYKNGNRKPGFGTYVWDDGTFENRTNKVSYEERGCVSGDCENGWGVYIFKNGDLHAGYWKNGNQHFFGAKFWASGDYYLGLYKDGSRKPNAHGYYVFKGGKSKSHLGPVKYSDTGCLAGDCNNGFGTYIWTNGDIHTGFWKNGKAHLIAFKFWHDKDTFIGFYKNGKRQKRGIYIYETGEVEYRTDKVTFNDSDAINTIKKKQINNDRDGEYK